jgi:hypothetical protein
MKTFCRFSKRKSNVNAGIEDIGTNLEYLGILKRRIKLRGTNIRFAIYNTVYEASLSQEII